MVENRWTMKNSVFLDTSYSVALTITKDANHANAVALANWIKTSSVSVVTTQAVILEIGNALSRQRYRKTAIGIIRRYDSDQNTSIISLTAELYEEGFELFCNRPDKDWSLIDCISFVVMKERGIDAALTSDGHFVQAGFRALLRED